MFGVKRPKVVLYLKNKSLQIYQKDSSNPLELTFSDEGVKNLEVLNLPRFEASLNDFITQNKLKGNNAVLVLSQESFYQKSFLSSDSESNDFETQKFLDGVPFEGPKIAKKIIPNEGKIFVFAANKDLFYAIISVFERKGWKIWGVYPVTAFLDVGKESQLSSGEVEQILSSRNALNQVNFLENLNPSPSENKKGWLLSGLLISFSILAISAIAYWFLLRPQPKKEEVSSIKPESLKQTEASGSAVNEATDSASEESTSSAKIKVLNGSGIAGQAAKVKEILGGLGYKDVETGNTETSDNTQTIAAFSSKTSDKVRQEIITELKKLFSDVDQQESEDAEFDIIITTGKPKEE